MRVNFNLPEQSLINKFGDIKIGEFFGIQGASQICAGVKICENEALIYGEEPESFPARWRFSPSEDVIVYNATITLREERSIKNESEF